MAGRIRRGTLAVGAAVANVADFTWNDQHEFDRSRADNEASGKPVLMKVAGRGSCTLLAGFIASGIQAADWVYTYNQVDVGPMNAETVTPKVVTFKDVTVNSGGNVPAEGKGEIRIEFEYSTATLA